MTALNDDEIAATCIGAEAGNQPHEGRVAVGIVILNRTRSGYMSDKTIHGTVTRPYQFSWLNGPPGGVDVRLEAECAKLGKTPQWPDYELAWEDANAWANGSPMSFAPGPAFAGLSSKTVLYLNPALVHPLPTWADPAKRDAVIYDHEFFHA